MIYRQNFWRINARRVFWMLALGSQGAIILLGGMSAFHQWQAGRVEVATAIDELERLRSIANYGRSTKDKPAEASFSAAFLGEGTASVLSANLITVLKQKAEASGIQVQAANPLPLKAEKEISWLGVNLQASGNWPSVVGFLQQVQLSEPLLMVDRVELRSMQPPEVQNNSDSIFQVNIDVSGAVPAVLDVNDKLTPQ